MLIKREIEALAVYMLLPLVLALVVIALVISSETFARSNYRQLGVSSGVVLSFWGISGFLSLYFAGIGSYQSYTDRNAKVSTFLCTLATTRHQIFAAKTIAAVVYILIVLILLAGAYVILLMILPSRPVLLNPSGLLGRMIFTAFWAHLAGYGLGLLLGWNQGRIIPTFGPLLLSIVILCMILIKGFSLSAGVVLMLAAAAALGRAWQKFSTMPLQ
ncbi:MAG: hypothetical protein AMJ79_16150 [Phycisphaerae bacterium SM23_30]|nr:MAG: hypothetical protein AMJ79_16150 [Phycisphaerae bacterium SM23_30]